jgi:hypothetical protein
MTNHRILIAVCAAFLFVTACKKKDDQPASGGDKAAETKPAEKPTDDPGKAPAADDPRKSPAGDKPADKPAGGGAIANTADYEARGTAVMDKLMGIFTADGKNCDKLAADITKFIEDNRADMEAVTAYEKAHPADKTAIEKKMEAKAKEFTAKLTPAMDACKNLQEVIAKIPMD